jgi:hypothetical protein
MPGLNLLQSGLYQGLMRGVFEKTHTLSQSGDYYCDDDNKIIILNQCYLAGSGVKGKNEEISNKLASLSITIDNFEQYHIIAPLIGNGVTERHITCFYLPQNHHDTPMIFDPKTSSPERFIGNENDFNKPWGAIKGMFRATFMPNYSKTRVQGSVLSNVSYHALGTQSYFDPATCGYHTLLTIEALNQLIAKGCNISKKTLLAQLNENPSLPNRIDTLFSDFDRTITTSYISFLRQAWHETFMPQVIDHERNSYHFGHYFLGFPKHGGTKGILFYLFSLGFLRIPVTNIVKLFTEFPLKALSESADFLRHKLMSHAPCNNVMQYLRSALLVVSTLMVGFFEGLRIATRTLTSPITSAKKGFKIHPLLGIASMMVSTILLFGVLAGILIATGGAASIPIIASVLASLPMVAANLTTAAIFAGIALVFTSFIAGFNTIISRFFYSDTPKKGADGPRIVIESLGDSSIESDFVAIERGQNDMPHSRPTSLSKTLLDNQPSPKGVGKIKKQQKLPEPRLSDSDSFEFV